MLGKERRKFTTVVSLCFSHERRVKTVDVINSCEHSARVVSNARAFSCGLRAQKVKSLEVLLQSQMLLHLATQDIYV